MALDSVSLRTSEGSQFSGRLPPPYHLYDILREFHTSMVTTGQQPAISIRYPASQVVSADARADERSLLSSASTSVVRNAKAPRLSMVLSGSQRDRNVLNRRQLSHIYFQEYADHRRVQDRTSCRKKSVDSSDDQLSDAEDELLTSGIVGLEDGKTLPQDDPLLSVQEEKHFSCMWLGCERAFSSENYLNGHIIWTHDWEYQECPESMCSRDGSKKFVTRGSLIAHLLEDHVLPSWRRRALLLRRRAIQAARPRRPRGAFIRMWHHMVQ